MIKFDLLSVNSVRDTETDLLFIHFQPQMPSPKVIPTLKDPDIFRYCNQFAHWQPHFENKTIVVPTQLKQIARTLNFNFQGSRDGMVVRGLASLHCGPGSIPGPGVTCGLSFYCFFLSLLQGFFSSSSSFLPSTKTKILGSDSA